jgi:hypothetical protein
MKGILFAGDSFTWGEGLHLYSDLPDIDYNEVSFNHCRYTPAHKDWINANRFSRRVANHFETFDLVRYHNGGNNNEIFDFIDNIEKVYADRYVDAQDSTHRMFRYKMIDFDYIVVQLTDMFRAKVEFIHNNIIKKCSIRSEDSIKETEFDKYLQEIHNNDINKFIDIFLDGFAKMVEQKFKQYESMGVKKCLIHTWQNELIPYIKNNSFLNDRFIEYNVNGNIVSSIWDLQLRNGMSISDDPYFTTISKQVVNGHTSLKAHKIQAEAIINKIEEIEKQIIWQTQNTHPIKMH